ncbi:NAD-dependent protein deacylase [Azomonas macrocytogenes]|nr:NAD-dependent protein deacylase [Azomonas macrocytogenes]
MPQAIDTVAEALRKAGRILIISGAGLSADSGLPTYRGLGGLYNGHTTEGLPIETALSGNMLRRDPALCWKYLAELGKACQGALPNLAHRIIAALQVQYPGCWILTQNIDGYHLQAGSPPERLIEIHGQLRPLFCPSCGFTSDELDTCLHGPLPPRCEDCGGVLRPSVVLFGEMLPARALQTLQERVDMGFDLVMSVGTTASFPYVVEPLLQVRDAGGFSVEINPERTAISDMVDVHLAMGAVAAFQSLAATIGLVSEISADWFMPAG